MGSRAASGFTAVELLVATALGLGVMSLVTQSSLQVIQHQRQWLQQARVQQDLRHLSELLRREIRRSGRQQSAEQSLWPEGDRPGQANPWAPLWSSADRRTLLYSHESSDGRGHHGWRQNTRTASIDLRLQGSTLLASADDQWQALQDTHLWAAQDSTFSVETDQASLLEACPWQECLPSDKSCPPRWTRHRVHAQGLASSVMPGTSNPAWSASVRSRNIALVGRCPSKP